LIRRLGVGGMAEVWLARRAGRRVQAGGRIKAADEAASARRCGAAFIQERDILASLEHPQIARFYDAGIDPNAASTSAMELCARRCERTRVFGAIPIAS